MWTKRVVTEMGGRDPLGLSRLGDTIKEFLLSGINTNNTRARYYSFYCWALWHIEQEEKLRNDREFIDAFRRREAAMALATMAHNRETSPVGVKAVRPRLDEGLAAGVFDCDFKVLPSNSLGGYGQYYAGSLYHLKLYHRPENSFDMVTPGFGEGVARAFHATIERTPYVRKELFRETEIAKGDLLKSAEFLTLDALGRNFCKAEREGLIDVFFGFSDSAPGETTVLRRHSLALLLHDIAEYERNGVRPDASTGGDLDGYLLYAFYYDVLWLDDKKTVAYRAPKELAFCHGLWRQFCLHQFLTQALELLLYGVLELLSADAAGLPPDEISVRLAETDFTDTLAEVAGRSCGRPSDMLAALGVRAVPDEASSLQLRKGLLPTHRLSEAQILNMKVGSAQREAARGILLLATLYGKWRGARQDYALGYVASRAGQDVWSGSVLPTLDCWLDPQVSWEEALRAFVEAFVLNQHDRVMYEKGKLESCWLQRAGGRVVKEQYYEPAWRSSRHYNAVRIMRDLGLVMIDEDDCVSVTAGGRRALEKALKLSHGAQEEHKPF
jgi:hypothetical protein